MTLHQGRVRTAAAVLIALTAWLGSVTGATAQPIAINDFFVPTLGSAPVGIVTGPDGALWFTEQATNKIGRLVPPVPPSTVANITEFTLPTLNNGPTGITVGPDGALWFTEQNTNKIGRLVPPVPPSTVANITEFTLPTLNNRPTGITVGPDGALWFTEQNTNKIGRLVPPVPPSTVANITEFTLPTPNNGPTGIVTGPDGALWFTEQNTNKIGRLFPPVPPSTVANITEFTIPTLASAPTGITVGPDGALWFTEQDTNKIGRLVPPPPPSTVANFTEFVVPTPNSAPTGIVTGPDGALWFTEQDTNKIGRLVPPVPPSTVANITEIVVTTLDSGPREITVGPDGRLWFTETAANKIGRVTITLRLTIALAGTGSGSVSSSPAGIACPPTCVATFPSATTVTLSALPAAGSVFAGFLGTGCGAATPCPFVLTASVTVPAVFNLPVLNVTKAGNGTGTVTSAPPGIDCGADCSNAYPSGTVVTLTALAAPGSNFLGFIGGGCAGIAPCVVTVNAPVINVIAAFNMFVGGVFVASGNLDGVGAAEIVTGAGVGGGPHVRTFSGNGTPLATSFFAYPAGFTGGVRVAVGDVDANGTQDLITGAGPGGGPHVRVLNGTNPAVNLASFFAFAPTFTGGVFVAAGRVNMNGSADVIVGAGAGGGPHVRVFEGTPLAEIYSFFPFSPAFRGGVRVAAGDVDGDGRADIVVGAGPGGGPHVRVFSGATLAELASFFAFNPGFTGGVFVAAGDLDGDGRADLVVGADAGGGAHVRAFSGATLAQLASFFAFPAGFTGGVRVAVGDVSGDGQNDIITAAGPGGGPQVRAFTAGGVPLPTSFFPY